MNLPLFIKNRTLHLSILLFVTLNLISCKKFVQIDPPVTRATSGTVFSSEATATSAQLNIYKNMFSQTGFDNQKFALLADELNNYSPDVSIESWYLNALSPSSTNLPWTIQYNYIYQANSVLEGLASTNNSIERSVRDQLTGEALFVRAFWYLFLTSWYGDVPLVLSTDYKANSQLGRTSQINVFQQIIVDLTTAKGLMSMKYVDKTDTIESLERVRPNKSVAQALLARAYLYCGKYDSAEIQATEVINNSYYLLEPDLNNVFLVTSREAIWQLATPLPSYSVNTQDGRSFILNMSPSTADISKCTTISSQLLQSFEIGDQRRSKWIGTLTDSSGQILVDYYYPFKYKIDLSSSISEYTMVLRIAEQYLIRAEARAQQDNLSGAIEDLNVIRHRAGLGDYNNSIENKDSVLTAILHERQVELFTECGHRWIDLVRTGNAKGIMSVVTPQKGNVWSPDGHQQLLPIPQLERQANPNLTQNPGYF